MFPNSTDLAFYSSKTRPAWAARLSPQVPATSIDSVVNSHGGVRHTSGEVAAYNLMQFIRPAALRGESASGKLERILRERLSAPGAKRRFGFARKWLARMEATP